MARIQSNHSTRAAAWGSIRRRGARLGLGLVAAVAILAAVGATYQAVGDAADRRDAPAPGRLVPVDGHAMHLYCTGEGSPTVVLEAGATGFAQTWGWIQPELAKTTRVCSYDRPGMGWSEEWETEHDGTTIARHLRALLESAGEAGPYVLAGHSLGGPLVRIFAAQHPDEVVGLALIDPSHEDQLDRFPAEARRQQEQFYSVIDLASKLAPVGILRATNLVGRSAEGLPERDYRTARMLGASAAHLRSSHAELLAWDLTMDAARRSPSLGDRPLVVISATSRMEGVPEGYMEVNQTMHAELAELSTRGEHVKLEGTDHFSVLMDRDDALRVAAVLRGLVEQAR